MKKKIRYFGFLLIVGFLTFLSLLSQFSTVFGAPTATPGPKNKPLALSLEAQAGHSDGILILGILIFAIIAIPILINYRSSRSRN